MTEGDAVRVNCRVRGRPEPQVAWFLRGDRVRPGERVKVVVNEAGCHTLLITKAQLDDQGAIGCVASNRSGQQTFQVTCVVCCAYKAKCGTPWPNPRFQCNLTVLPRQRMEAPSFVKKLVAQRVQLCQRVELQVVAKGTPTPNLTWLKVKRSASPPLLLNASY